MKKSLFLVLAAAGMLAGCSSNESFDGGSYSENINDADYSKVPIEIGVSRIATLDVRGTGTVGDVTGGANNVWRNQKINVLMFEKGTLNLAIIDKSVDQNPIYDKTTFTTPNNLNSAIANDSSNAINYYPQKGNFDFWGYRLDGADKVGGLAPQPVAAEVTKATEYTYGYDGDKVELNFKIDGTQDVMIAKAAPSETDQTDHAEASNRAYSAYSARNGVQPELIFKHLLTRLNFLVIAGDDNALGDGTPWNNDPKTNTNTGIWVKDIKVKSKASGKLIAAYTGDTIEDKNRIVWAEDEELTEFTLRSRDPNTADDPNSELLDTLIYTQPTSTTEATQVGEAMLVAPADQYELEITLLQAKPQVKGGPNIYDEKGFTVPATISNGDTGFLLGHSYNITIKLFGKQEIEITTTLSGWENGGDIPTITPEDNI